MTSFAQKKHSDFAPFVVEARQEVWYAVYGSIAEEGTSPSRAASSFGEAHARRRRAKPAEEGTIITVAKLLHSTTRERICIDQGAQSTVQAAKQHCTQIAHDVIRRHYR